MDIDNSIVVIHFLIYIINLIQSATLFHTPGCHLSVFHRHLNQITTKAPAEDQQLLPQEKLMSSTLYNHLISRCSKAANTAQLHFPP